MARAEITNYGGQEVKVQGHMRTKIDWDPGRAIFLNSSSRVAFLSVLASFIITNAHFLLINAFQTY